MDTFLVRTLLVPSTVVLLGRWNWWPSRMSRAGAVSPAPEMAAARQGEPAQRGGLVPDDGQAAPAAPAPPPANRHF